MYIWNHIHILYISFNYPLSTLKVKLKTLQFKTVIDKYCYFNYWFF